MLFLLCPSAKADFVTDVFGSKNCSKPGTMTTDTAEELGPVASFDLSSIPKTASVYRAILKVVVNRPNYKPPVTFYPVVQTATQPQRADRPLVLRAPFFQDFDATEAVRAAVKAGAKAQFLAASAPGWQRDQTTLLVSYQGQGKPTPAVAGLEATFDSGQLFLRWREIEDVIAAEEIKYEDFEAKVIEARKQRSVVYRVYRHSQPITADTLGQAELMRQVEEIIPAYNLDAVPTTEFPGRNSRPSKLGLGGNRVTDVILQRFKLPGDKQLISGEDLAVMTARANGEFYYAVTAAVDGYEAVAKLDGGNSLAKPVSEKVQPVAPLLQKKVTAKRGQSEDVTEYYVCFYEPPYWPTALRVEMVSMYTAASLTGGGSASAEAATDAPRRRKVPLEFCCGIYGGQAPYNLGRRYAAGGVYIAPPVCGPMGQGLHECLGTLKSYDQGLVRNYPHRQILALVEWAKTKWPIDDQRIVINGQFALWALRYPDLFAMVIADPYGDYAGGLEMQKQGMSWGLYPQAAKNEDGNVDQWEYLNLAKWLKDNPSKEVPFYCGGPSSATHVGDMGFMDCPETYRALLDSKRAFAARWGHSLGTGAPATATWPIRKNMPVPAFANCALDDMIGEGDQWGGAGGGTIGSGDPFGQFNSFLCWDLEAITDEPDRFEITLWLDKTARKDTCTVDLTPRRCQKFKATSGDKFAWSIADAAGKSPTRQSRYGDGAESPKAVGTTGFKPVPTTADANGLVTIQKLTVTKDKSRLKIVRQP